MLKEIILRNNIILNKYIMIELINSKASMG